MNSSFIQRGGLWVLVQFIFLLAVLVLAVVYHGDWSRVWMTVAGAGLFAIGGCFGVTGARALGRVRTPFPKPREDSLLIQHGIYSRVRHPLYTSVMLLSLGWGLVWQSWAALVVALAQIPFFAAKAVREECWLREKFPDYEDYAKRVPRFVPRLHIAGKVCL